MNRSQTSVRRFSLEIENRAAQLALLLTLVHGNGHQAFESLFPHDRDNILWLAAGLAAAINAEINGGAQ